MKRLFLMILLAGLISCSNGTQQKEAKTAVAATSPVRADSSSFEVFNAAMDSVDVPAKEAAMKAASFEKAAWRDTACGVCSRRCCVSCTSGGNPAQCAQTKFSTCNTCGHASSQHYSASQ